LVLSGKADYQPSPGYEDKLHSVGPKGSPVWIGKKGDVPKLLSEQFWDAYHAWERFHLGFPGPDPATRTADIVMMMEGQYQAHFCWERHIFDRVTTLIEMMRPKRVR